MATTRAAAGLALAALLSTGCAGTGVADAPPPAEHDKTPVTALPMLWPIGLAEYPTTSGETYLANLDARVAMLEARLAAADSEATRIGLAGARYHRYRLRGRLDDAERALALVDDPTHPLTRADGLLLRSVVLAGFHRFDAAAAALDAAAAGGADPAALRRHRDDLRVARGDYAALADDLAHSLQPVPDLFQLAHRADLRVLLGDLQGAERQYRAAQTLFDDVSPVPLAWLHTQMGIALLRFGEIEAARRFFAAAVERLPGYYLAEEHLAECDALLGDTDAARARYVRVIEATGNPEFIAALAELEDDAGHPERAAVLRQQARDGFEQWLARHPAAAAQHAAEFFLDAGDVPRAHALARDNAALRSDAGSRLLLAETALASGDLPLACAQLQAVRDAGVSPPELADVQLPDGACPTPTPTPGARTL